MRSLYALHPETVLQLHERGAAVYGQPLTLSLAETEDRMLHEEYARVVIDPGLVRSGEEQRALRRIEVVHPDAEIAWLRGRFTARGDLALDDLAAELRGEPSGEQPALAVVVAPGDAGQGAVVALAVACHLARSRSTLLVETDTAEPQYARRLKLKPCLAAYMSSGQSQELPGYPRRLRVVPAPIQPQLLLRSGMEPLLDRLERDRGERHVVVRASANLGDRGLIASLAHASDILLATAAVEDEYRRWLAGLAPLAALTEVPAGRLPLRRQTLARHGAEIWRRRGETADHAL